MASRLRHWRNLIAGATLLLSGCVEVTPLEPSYQKPLIHAVLDAAADTQFVFVTGTAGPLESADVTISNGSTIRRLLRRAESSNVGVLATRAFVMPTVDVNDRLIPGEEYRLEVEMRNGLRLSSTTTVPNARPSSTVSSGSHEFGSNLLIDWELVPGVSRYYVTVSVPNGGDIYGNPRITLGRFASSPLQLTQEELNLRENFSMGSTFDVAVSVVDQHFERYFSIRTDPFSGTRLPSQFVDAYGVFGAATPIKRTRYTLTFRNRPPCPPCSNN